MSSARIMMAGCLLCAAMGVFGQDADSAKTVPRRLLLFVSQAEGAGYQADELVLISRSFLLRLQSGVKGVIIVDPGPDAAPETDERRSAAAESAGADCWLWVEIGREEASARLHVRSYDVFYREATIDTVVIRENKLSVLSLPDESWEDIVGSVAGAYQAVSVASMPAAGSSPVLLTIRALPQTVVTVSGGHEVTIGADGMAPLYVSAPGEYQLRARLPGYSPITRGVYVTADREVDLAQVPGARWALEVSLVDLGYPGVAASIFIVPDALFLRFGATTYALGLALNQTDVFSSRPLTNIVLQVGLSLFPVDSSFRPYLAFGGLLRLVHAAPAYTGLDPIAPAGAQLVIGAEMSRNPRARFFVEYMPTVYMTRVPTLMRASLGFGGPPPGWHFTEVSAEQLLTFRLGFRWMP